MTVIELILTAIALAMDCFAVSIVCGMVMKRVQLWPMFKIAFFFGLFQAMMPCIGWFCGTQFYHLISRVDHWIAFGILAFLG
ncbi:MAG: manganese efflux pump, partial [Bacteroidales bacterium]|nr:manganese efflux pump [Bacteroidales bacterium]